MRRASVGMRFSGLAMRLAVTLAFQIIGQPYQQLERSFWVGIPLIEHGKSQCTTALGYH
jgi:hypothetical protein